MTSKPPRPSPWWRLPAPGADPGYDQLADKVGMVPNLRGRDNLWQGIAAVAGLLLGAACGAIRYGLPTGMLVGALVGLASGTFLAGLALMVVGWRRR